MQGFTFADTTHFTFHCCTRFGKPPGLSILLHVTLLQVRGRAGDEWHGWVSRHGL